jgi:uncharacterized delta-60 repeat protein
MKPLARIRSHVPVYELAAVFLLLSSQDSRTHPAPTTPISDLVRASEGDLDSSFGTGGKLTTDFFNHMDLATDMVLQPDGRIIVVGITAVGRNVGSDIFAIDQSAFAILRYNSDGSLDDSFGNGGKVTTDFLGFPVGANAVALCPDGKIVVVGSVDYDKDEASDFGIARYNSNGSLDTTFDNDGKVMAGFTAFNNASHAFDNSAHAVSVQPDGKIVVVGFAGRGPNSNTGPEFGLVRYNIDGTPDSSFGANGKAFTDFFGSVDDPKALVIQPDGKIIVAGDIVNVPADTNHDFGLVRYNSDGSLDAAFGDNGRVTTDFFRTSDVAQAMILQPDGKIITGGYVFGSGRHYDFGLARYNSDGSLDSSFGASGKTVTDFFGLRDKLTALTIQPDGKIIAGGSASTSSDDRSSLVALARYNSNGSLDSSFGLDGKMYSDFFGRRNAATALALQPDGKLVAAGSAHRDANDYDIALLRFFAFTPPDFVLELSTPAVQASRGEKVRVNVQIGRVGGFTGNVIVSVPDTSAVGIAVNPNPASTTGSKIKFKLKLKGSAPAGTLQVTFTGRDEVGRERKATLAVVVQP